MKTYEQFVLEAKKMTAAPRNLPRGKQSGKQVGYRKMEDLGDAPNNFDELDIKTMNPHNLSTGGDNISSRRIALSNPSIVDDVLTKSQIARTRADISGNAKNRHHIGPKVQGD